MSKLTRRQKKARAKKRKAEQSFSPVVTVRDPLAEKIAELELVQKEYEQMMDTIRAALAESKQGHEDAMGHANEMIEEAKHGKSVEELEKIRAIAGREQFKDISQRRAVIVQEAKELLTGPKMTFTPQVDDLIVMGGAHFYFTAGLEDKYPKMVIEAYMDKRRGLAELHRTKTALGATGPGYAAELEPRLVADFTGQVRRPLAEHRALLEAAGIEQSFGG